MISRTYKSIINRREYDVSFRVYACHMTRKLKFLQPSEFYDDFIRDFRFGSFKELQEYLMMYIGRKVSIDMLFNQENYNQGVAPLAMQSVIVAAWAAEYYKNWYGLWIEDKHRSEEETLTTIFDENINYVEGFSEGYQSIGTLMSLYHNLVYGIEDDLPVMRTIITEENINVCLKDLGETVRVKDIEEDIHEHAVLVKRGDHYEWTSPHIAKLLYRFDISLLHAFNTEKLLRKIRYVS